MIRFFNTTNKKVTMSIFKMLIILGVPMVLFASQPVGLVKSVRGKAFERINDTKSIPLKAGDKIYEKDTIKTEAGSFIGIILEDNTLISIGSNSEFSIEEYLFEPKDKKVKFTSNLAKGSLSCMTGLIAKINPDAMQLKVKSASMGIRGTYFIVDVNE